MTAHYRTIIVGAGIVRVPDCIVRGIRISTGDITCDELVLCGRIWGPLLGRSTDTPSRSIQSAHPCVRSTPLPEPEYLAYEQIVQPLWRHQDHSEHRAHHRILRHARPGNGHKDAADIVKRWAIGNRQ